MNIGKIDKSRFRVNFDNLAFVGALPTGNDDVPFVNLGFAYNKIRDFNRKYNVAGSRLSSSVTDYMAERANYSYGNVTASDPYNSTTDWLGGLGYHSGFIGLDNNGEWFGSILNQNEKVSSDLYVREKGRINSYDFSVGTTFIDKLSFGLSLSVTDLDYHIYSSYIEDFVEYAGEGLELANEVKSEGTGYQVKAGLIFKPVHELRIGVAYHSPTWYEITNYHYGDVFNFSDSNLDEGTPYGEYSYDFKTPDKWVFSVAGVIENMLILSLDYELTNYKNAMKFRDVHSGSDLDRLNSYIKQDYKNASTIRVGAEVRFTPQFSGRVGYAWMQSPYDDKVKDNEMEIGFAGNSTMPHYVVDGDVNYFTYGLGYRFTTNFYMDVAFLMKNQKSDLYSFSNFVDPETNNLLVDNSDHKAKLKSNIFSGMVTFGVRF